MPCVSQPTAYHNRDEGLIAMAGRFEALVNITAITGDAILATLGRFPQEDRHGAFLAAETLQEALHAYMLTQRDKQ